MMRRVDGILDDLRVSLRRWYRDTYEAVADRFALEALEDLAGSVRKAKQDDELTQALIDFLGGKLAADQVRDLWQDRVGRYLAEEAGKRIVGVTTTQRDMIRRELSAGFRAGEGTDALASRIEGLYDREIIPNRAEVIARTEVVSASNLGGHEGVAAAGEVVGLDLEKQWVSAGNDGRTRAAHLGHDQKDLWVDVGKAHEVTFEGRVEELMFPGDSSLGASPGNTINCFPAGTIAHSPSRIERAFSRYYNGDLIEIRTARGHKLSGTPNHPILTRRGWIGLGDLQKGDCLLSCAAGKEVGLRHPYPENAPARIEEIHGALATLGITQRIAGRQVDFHGDGRDGDVHVSGPNAKLPAWLVSEGTEPSEDLTLAATGHGELAHLRLRDAQSGSPRRFGSLVRTAQRDVRGQRPRLSLLRTGSPHPDSHGLATIPRLDAVLEEMPADDATVHADGIRDRLLGGSIEVKADHVLELRRRRFSGHVFNLQTVEGLYIANGIVVHNCRCAQFYRPKPMVGARETAPV